MLGLKLNHVSKRGPSSQHMNTYWCDDNDKKSHNFTNDHIDCDSDVLGTTSQTHYELMIQICMLEIMIR